VRLVILSDTHVPQRARAIPEAVWRAIDDADVVIHAGDWDDVPLLDELEGRAAQLMAVYGNNDGPALRGRLPEVARETLGGVRFAVVHETGGRDGREARMSAQYPDTDVLVFGHSHIPWDSTTRTGLRLLNPGSPTDRRREPLATFLTTSVVDGELLDVTLRHADDGAPVAAPRRGDARIRFGSSRSMRP
jgi:putative phosphoesterase